MPSLFHSAKQFSKSSSEDSQKLVPNPPSSQTNTTAELLYKYGYASGVSFVAIPDMSKSLEKDISGKIEDQTEPAMNTADLIYKYGFGNNLIPTIVAPHDSLKDNSDKKIQEPSKDKVTVTKVFNQPELMMAPKLGRI